MFCSVVCCRVRCGLESWRYMTRFAVIGGDGMVFGAECTVNVPIHCWPCCTTFYRPVCCCRIPRRLPLKQDIGLLIDWQSSRLSFYPFWSEDTHLRVSSRSHCEPLQVRNLRPFTGTDCRFHLEFACHFIVRHSLFLWKTDENPIAAHCRWAINMVNGVSVISPWSTTNYNQFETAARCQHTLYLQIHRNSKKKTECIMEDSAKRKRTGQFETDSIGRYYTPNERRNEFETDTILSLCAVLPLIYGRWRAIRWAEWLRPIHEPSCPNRCLFYFYSLGLL